MGYLPAPGISAVRVNQAEKTRVNVVGLLCLKETLLNDFVFEGSGWSQMTG